MAGLGGDFDLERRQVRAVRQLLLRLQAIHLGVHDRQLRHAPGMAPGVFQCHAAAIAVADEDAAFDSQVIDQGGEVFRHGHRVVAGLRHAAIAVAAQVEQGDAEMPRQRHGVMQEPEGAAGGEAVHQDQVGAFAHLLVGDVDAVEGGFSHGGYAPKSGYFVIPAQAGIQFCAAADSVLL